MRRKQNTILFTFDEYSVGGTTTFVNQYASIAKKLGHRVIILGCKGDIVDVKNFFSGARTITIPHSMELGTIGRIRSVFRFTRALRQIYLQEKITILHLSTTWSTIATMFCQNSWKTKRIITMYGLYDKEIFSMDPDKKTILFKAKMFLGKFLQYLTLLYAHHIVVFGKYSKTQVFHSYGVSLKKKIVIIPGFLISLPKPIGHKKKKNILTLINYGRAEPRKGIDLLLEALKKINFNKQKYRAIIASPVRYYRDFSVLNTYESLNLYTQVQFIHAVNDKQKSDLLNIADLFVLPSLDLETFGMTTIESLGTGVPVIGTPVGETKEILSRIDRRLLCKSTSSDAICKKLLWFYQLSQQEKEKISEVSVACVLKYYIQSHHIDVFKNLYNQKNDTELIR